MDLFVYSDESGVFDKAHNDYFVYGGLIFLGKDQKDTFARKYIHAEKVIRKGKYTDQEELKASRISNKEKGKLYRSLNNAIKFGVIINQENVLDRIFLSKKDRQRYLDFAYKVGLKKALQALISENKICAADIRNIHVFNDEHTTATNGRYELREALEREFKIGTYNWNYDKYFPPLLPEMSGGIDLFFCNSSTTTLVRAADIIANRIYHAVLSDKIDSLNGIYLSTLPS